MLEEYNDRCQQTPSYRYRSQSFETKSRLSLTLASLMPCTTWNLFDGPIEVDQRTDIIHRRGCLHPQMMRILSYLHRIAGTFFDVRDKSSLRAR